MLYGEFKETDICLNAKDITLIVDGNELDPIYYPNEFDDYLVVGFASLIDGTIEVDLINMECED